MSLLQIGHCHHAATFLGFNRSLEISHLSESGFRMSIQVLSHGQPIIVAKLMLTHQLVTLLLQLVHFVTANKKGIAELLQSRLITLSSHQPARATEQTLRVTLVFGYGKVCVPDGGCPGAEPKPHFRLIRKSGNIVGIQVCRFSVTLQRFIKLTAFKFLVPINSILVTRYFIGCGCVWGCHVLRSGFARISRLVDHSRCRLYRIRGLFRGSELHWNDLGYNRSYGLDDCRSRHSSSCLDWSSCSLEGSRFCWFHITTDNHL